MVVVVVEFVNGFVAGDSCSVDAVVVVVLIDGCVVDVVVVLIDGCVVDVVVVVVLIDGCRD